MTAAIETHKLTKWYGHRSRGILDVDLVVEAGQIFGFLGPNGAGKSTTIRLLLDLIRPTSGSAQVLGLDVHRDRLAIDRRVSYVPGELSLYSDLTGRQLLTYLGNLQGSVDAAYREKLIERLELDPDQEDQEPLARQQAEGGAGGRLHDPAGAAHHRRAYGRPGSLHPARIRAPLRRGPRPRAGRSSSRPTSCPRSSTCATASGSSAKAGCWRSNRSRRSRSGPCAGSRSTSAGRSRPTAFANLPGVRDLTVDDGVLRCTVMGSLDALVKAAARFEVRNLRSIETSLEEIFLAYYGAGDGAAGARRLAMLLRNVFTKTIRDLRWPTFWVALGMGGMTAYFAILFPTYSQDPRPQLPAGEDGPGGQAHGRAAATRTRLSASCTSSSSR